MSSFTPTIVTRAIQHEGSFFSLLRKTLAVVRREGINGIRRRVRHLNIVGSVPAPPSIEQISYVDWLHLHEKPATDVLGWQLRSTTIRFKFSIVMPVYNPDPDTLYAAIQSVIDQSYPYWELIVCDDASSNFSLMSFLLEIAEPRIKAVYRQENGNISAATNSAIEHATGDYIAFMDQDDLLHQDALAWTSTAIWNNPDLKLIYSDEDKLSEQGQRCEPHFKPDWNYHYFLGCNYICHFTVVDTSVVREVQGCRIGYEGAQDYDFLLRVVEHIDPSLIHHIPRVLYHWRKHPGSTSFDLLAKPDAVNAGLRALKDHLIRTGLNGEATMHNIRYHVTFSVSEIEPVTIIIPTRNRADLMQACLSSIFKKTVYQNYRILIIDNNSDEPDCLEYFEQLSGNDKITIIKDEREFNYAELMNRAVDLVDTDVICLLNNDVEVISEGWLTEMLSVLQQQDVGAVGAKLLFDDNTVQHGGVILGIGGIAGHAHKYMPDTQFGYADRNICRQEMSAVTAACMLTRKTIYQAAGGMDELGLKVAFNDIDFCLKVRDLKYKIVWTPFSKLYHHESKSRGAENSETKVRRFNREVETMKKRWGKKLVYDPAYNPNLSDEFEDFRLANNPRPVRL